MSKDVPFGRIGIACAGTESPQVFSPDYVVRFILRGKAFRSRAIISRSQMQEMIPRVCETGCLICDPWSH